MKVLTVFGTRPEAIKMCPLVLEMNCNKNIKNITCLTGQHKEMLIQVMNVFGIKEDYNLNIMRPNQDLFTITIDILEGIKSIIEREKPDVLLVHGDTTTSFAAGLAGFYMQIPVGHVEAGLRTYNVCSPFPEEFNRQAVDIFSDIYFAPTKEAQYNLIREGKNKSNIFVTGNTVIDAMKYTVSEDYNDENIQWASDCKMILLTMHRRENLGDPMRQVFRACNKIVTNNKNVKIIFPIHKNPKVREIAIEEFKNNKNIRLIEPLDVVAFHNYMNKAYLVLTDSGGIQEEAPSIGKPVLVLRDTTERPEGIIAGMLKLVGTKEENIYKEVVNLLKNSEDYIQMSTSNNPYGDGEASKKIVEILLSRYRKNKV